MNHTILPSALVTLIVVSSSVAQAEYSFTWRNPLPQGNALESVAPLGATTAWAVGARGTCLVTHDSGASWSDLTAFDDFSADLFDAVALDGSTLVAVGETPGIFRSVDGGVSWSSIVNPSTGVLRDIDVVSGSILSAVGENGQALRSFDGGASWVARPTGQSGTALAQHWFDASHGIVVGQPMAVRTDDGGVTWEPIPDLGPGSFNDVAFVDALTGFVVADFATWKTIDGGLDWIEIGHIGAGPIYQRRLIAVNENRRFVVTSTEGAEIWETIDDGDTWEVHVSQQSTVGFQDAVRLPGGTVLVVSTEGDLYRGASDGQAWTNGTSSPGSGDRSEVSAIEFLPGGRVYAGCRRQAASTITRWFRSDDGGLSWIESVNKPGSAYIEAIEFLDDQLGLVAGFSPGRIWRTQDGGDTWTGIVPPLSGIVSDVSFADATNAFATMITETQGILLRSADGGSSWSTVPSVTSERMESVEFATQAIGYAGGGTFFGPSLYKTTDGGATWSSVPATGLTTRIDCMYWLDASTGLAAQFGGIGGIFRTTNGGQNWARVSTVATNAIEFSGPGRGIAAGYSPEALQRSVDGGATWQPIPSPFAGYIGTVAARPDRFLVGGQGSVILEVRDEGAVAVTPGTGTLPLTNALGDPSLSVRRAAGRFLLHFNLLEAGDASLRIYDVRGRRMADLISGAAPREGTVEWSGRDAAGHLVAPGVYFARLVTRGGFAVGRILVVP